MDLPKPQEMTGASLLRQKAEASRSARVAGT
jgi:hypothetical protein